MALYFFGIPACLPIVFLFQRIFSWWVGKKEKKILEEYFSECERTWLYGRFFFFFFFFFFFPSFLPFTIFLFFFFFFFFFFSDRFHSKSTNKS